jgi:hypothetical protein
MYEILKDVSLHIICVHNILISMHDAFLEKISSVISSLCLLAVSSLTSILNRMATIFLVDAM